MFISDQQFEKRSKSKSQIIFEPLPLDFEPPPLEDSRQIPIENEPQLRVESHQFRGRTLDATNIPDFLRPIIGASAYFSGGRETAKEFGINESIVSLTKHGKVASSDGPIEKPGLKGKVDEIVGQAQKTAADKLLKALGFIDDDKLENAKARDLSAIASDMSKVIERTTPKQAEASQTQIIVYAPQIKNETSYEIIESE